MSSEASDDDDRNNVVVLEQPHRNVGKSCDLDSVDAAEETTTFSDELRTQKTKSSASRLRWMNISTTASAKD
jgi:hypothetical protein